METWTFLYPAKPAARDQGQPVSGWCQERDCTSGSALSAGASALSLQCTGLSISAPVALGLLHLVSEVLRACHQAPQGMLIG